ncbi:hypothetical protein EYF80_044449 [Liparis tanakae]|uniref:Uncharacterized protein n=1 Tax=Liparis tanakae TaxID=230148 RepID=A0A4Z2FWS7_9TELE|nr:hypothetical protein EYF80_044449 [Liparis tanakae]
MYGSDMAGGTPDFPEPRASCVKRLQPGSQTASELLQQVVSAAVRDSWIVRGEEKRAPVTRLHRYGNGPDGHNKPSERRGNETLAWHAANMRSLPSAKPREPTQNAARTFQFHTNAPVGSGKASCCEAAAPTAESRAAHRSESS